MHSYKLWETTPAQEFPDAHFLGNGHLGASVLGGVPRETVFINDDTLWSGSENFYLNPNHYEKFREAQKLALAGRVKDANNIINDEMEGRWDEAYLPLATLQITMGQPDNRRNMPLKHVLNAELDPYSDYDRVLDLTRAVETVTYERTGIRYKREYFVSRPANALVMKFTAENGKLAFAMNLMSQLHADADAVGNEAFLTGIAPDHAEPNYSLVTPALVYHDPAESRALRFACAIRVIDTDGVVKADGQRVYVSDATYAVTALAAGTNYAGYKQERDPDAAKVLVRLRETLDAAGSWDELLKAHLEDYQALYNRFDLELGRDITAAVPTTKRMELCRHSMDDPSLSALALQYARYLTISGSRPGDQAMNLQGIWNDMTEAPWACNYTNNINVQMNYWPCETLALPECHLPMLNLVKELSDSGRRTAREYYHMNGWVTHHNSDLWRASEPSCEDAAWAWWPFGGAWMAQHIWTHYEYTKDEAFLAEMYPVLRECAAFMLDFLTEDAEGHLVTAPSISPENKFITGGPEDVTRLLDEISSGSRCDPSDPAISAVTCGSTMDMSILRELFGNVRKAAEILGIADDPLPEKLAEAAKRFPPYKTGRYGQLLEWAEDYEECCPGMGHISHMYPVYPGNVINPETEPELMTAAQKSMERRLLNGGGRGGWPCAWAICLFARFKQPFVCGMYLKNITSGMGASLVHGQFRQMDVSFGWGAAVAEMLLQSHAGYIELIPSITPDMATGSFRGMRARGGFEISAAWKTNRIENASVTSLAGETCRVKAAGLTAVIAPDGTEFPAEGGLAEFPTEKGATYTLRF